MKKHKTEIIVRYAETDRMGVVYYANYLVWFEVARTEFFKSIGLSYRSIEENNSLFLMVGESFVKHLSPVTYDDTVLIESWISEVKNASIVFRYTASCNGKFTAEGMTKHVFTDSLGKPRKIPIEIKKKITEREVNG